MPDYKALALQQLNPSLNAKIQALRNAANTSKQSLDQSKTGINANFNQQEEDQNMQNTVNKNNISNGALGRGLGRSSIVTSGLGEADAINSKYLNRLATARTAALNNIDQQKALIDTNTEGSIAQMNADLQNEAATLARQLEDSDWNKQLQEKQFELSKQAALSKQIAASKSASQIAKQQAEQIKADKLSIENEFYSMHNPTDRENWLKVYGDKIVEAAGGGNAGQAYLKTLINNTGKGVGSYYSVPHYLNG